MWKGGIRHASLQRCPLSTHTLQMVGTLLTEAAQLSGGVGDSGDSTSRFVHIGTSSFCGQSKFDRNVSIS